MASRRPLLARVGAALTALSGAGDAPPSAPAQEPRRLIALDPALEVAPMGDTPGTDVVRATVGNGLDFLNGTPGGISTVRTANPTEYKRDGATIRREGFQRHPVVQACMRVIVDQVAQIPFVVMTGRGPTAKRVGVGHPLQRLLDAPAYRVTARQLRARIALDVVGYGNALVEMVRKAPLTGKPLALRPLNVEGVQTVWVNDAGDAAIWEISNWNGRLLTIPAMDLLHFRDLDMPRPFQPDVFGYPRGAAAIESIIADREATAYVRQTVTNDGTPTFAILGDENLTQADALAMKERYHERVVKRGNRGKVDVFAGVKDIKALGFTLSELEFPDLRRVAREDIASAFGVDPRMIGIASATADAGLSGQQYREARSRLIQHSVEPLLALIVDELTSWLAPEFGNVVIDYDREVLRDLVEDDTATSTRVIAELGVPGLRTLEEGRVALKLPAQPPSTDTLVVPFGMQLVPVAAAVIDPSAVLEPTPAGGDAGDEPTDEPGGGEPTRALRTDTDPRRAHWLRQIQLLDQDEVAYAAAARSLFRDEKPAVGAIFADAAASSGRAVRAQTGDPTLAAATAKATSAYAPGGAYHAEWRERFEALIRKTYTTGNAAEVVGTAALDFRLPNAFVERAVVARAEALATYVGRTTAREITAVVLSGERAGLSIAEIGRLVEASVFGGHRTSTRALTIARTESAGAMSQGQWDQAKEAGVYQSKEWLAFDDNETRETHRACMAQGRIAIGDQFTANGMSYPMQAGAPPGEVINCRCRPIFYIEAAGEAVN